MGVEYKKTAWVNGETALNAEHMNHIEQGIDDLAEVLKDVGTIPTKTSQLVNDSGFITESDLTLSAQATWIGGALTDSNFPENPKMFPLGFTPTSLRIVERNQQGKVISSVLLQTDLVADDVVILFVENGFTASAIAGGRYNRQGYTYYCLGTYNGFVPLPTVFKTDVGKLLAVNEQGQWQAERVLPQIQPTDNGKFLCVQNGIFVLADVAAVSGGNVSYNPSAGSFTYTTPGQAISNTVQNVVVATLTAGTRISTADATVSNDLSVGNDLSVTNNASAKRVYLPFSDTRGGDYSTYGDGIWFSDNTYSLPLIRANSTWADFNDYPFVTIGIGTNSGARKNLSEPGVQITNRSQTSTIHFSVNTTFSSSTVRFESKDNDNKWNYVSLIAKPNDYLTTLSTGTLSLFEPYRYGSGNEVKVNGGEGVIVQGVSYPPASVSSSSLGRLAANKSYVDTRTIYYTDIKVPTTDFVSDSTYSSQGYSVAATIPFIEATASMSGNVTFSLADAISGNFAPIAETGAGYVKIYAHSVPTTSITIPTIALSEVPSTFTAVLEWWVDGNVEERMTITKRRGLTFHMDIAPTTGYTIDRIYASEGHDTLPSSYVTPNGDGTYTIQVPHVGDDIYAHIDQSSKTT